MAEPQLAPERWRRVVDIATDDAGVGWELTERNPEGLPNGSAGEVARAFAELVDDDVLAVLGPANSDNCTSLRPVVDGAEVPTLALGASLHVPSAWCFSVPWGSCAEDALLVAEWIVAHRHRRLAVVTDDLRHSAEYLEYLNVAARRHALTVVSLERLPATARDAAEAPAEQMELAAAAVERSRAAHPDVLVHLGPLSLAAVAAAVTEQSWDVPKVANNAFAAAQRPERASQFEGWVGTTCWHDDNELLTKLLARHLERFGEPASPDFAAVVHDAVRVLAEGLALAPERSRRGLRAGLERVRNLPSAMGHPDNVLTFGPWDHRALKGGSMMVLRRIDGGRSVMEERRSRRRG